MVFSAEHPEYAIEGQAGSSGMLRDGEVKYHHLHYLHGQKEFEAWMKQETGHEGEIRLSQHLGLAGRIANDGVLPDSALYNLQRWLKGRQTCYCHHLYRQTADDGHLHPIWIARELIEILKPENSEELIAECTPVNLADLVTEQGSAKAREMYTPSSASLLPSPTLLSEEKQRRMSGQSWRRSSDSSSCSTDSHYRPASSHSSRSTFISSLANWRSRSSSTNSFSCSRVG